MSVVVASTVGCCCGEPPEPCFLCLIPPFNQVNYPSPPSSVAVSGWIKSLTALVMTLDGTTFLTIPCGQQFNIPTVAVPRQPNIINSCSWTRQWIASEAPIIGSVGALTNFGPPLNVNAVVFRVEVGSGCVVFVRFTVTSGGTGYIPNDLSPYSVSGGGGKTCVAPASVFGIYTATQAICAQPSQQTASLLVS